MHVGADVIEGFPLAEAQTKTNIFASGYKGGMWVSVGDPLRDVVASSLKNWTDWCDYVASRPIDEC